MDEPTCGAVIPNSCIEKAHEITLFFAGPSFFEFGPFFAEEHQLPNQF
jgi:hypothetical protein